MIIVLILLILLISSKPIDFKIKAHIKSLQVRVPVEVVKQRCQATHVTTSVENARLVWAQEGVRGFYRGFGVTVYREIPFSVLQFPMWEFLKRKYAEKMNIERDLGFFESGFCGAISGGLAAAATTPIDVAKTRIMLAKENFKENNGFTIILIKKHNH